MVNFFAVKCVFIRDINAQLRCEFGTSTFKLFDRILKMSEGLVSTLG